MEKKKYESPTMRIYEMSVNPSLLNKSGCGYHRGNDSGDESE